MRRVLQRGEFAVVLVQSEKSRRHAGRVSGSGSGSGLGGREGGGGDGTRPRDRRRALVLDGRQVRGDGGGSGGSDDGGGRRVFDLEALAHVALERREHRERHPAVAAAKHARVERLLLVLVRVRVRVRAGGPCPNSFPARVPTRPVRLRGPVGRRGRGRRACASVRLHVARQLAALRARVAAQRTPVRPFSRVAAPVHRQV